MFEHSVKVPRLYKFAAKVAKQVKEDGASVKDQIYQIKHRNIKAIYALISTVFKKSNTLDYIIRSTQILMKENRMDPWLARVLITELLWGKKRLPNDNKPCQTIINYSKELTDCLATFSDDAPTKEPNKVKKPRYVRVNTLKLTTAEAINIFRDEGWMLLRCGDNSDYGSFLATVASLSYDQFIVDMHVKDLLVFPPNTQFYQHHLYLNGDIALQDKASCLAPLILSPEPKSSVLDMCSAPGMKASYLAAIIGKEGNVYAVERDLRRYQTLVKLMEGMSVENVKCLNKDVLTVTDREFPDVEYILVDPSCSGSGMLDRFDFEDADSKCNKSRLESLAGFQITILRHALNNFPKAKRVLYSTCSLYPEENESVVKQVITTVKDFKLIDLRETMKTKWFNFGSNANDFRGIGERCLYAKPEQDYTNGFFVALFERLNDNETNEFFVRRVKRSSECDNKENNPVNDEEENHFEEKQKKKKSKDTKVSTEIIEHQTVDENIKLKKKRKSKHIEKEENKNNVLVDENKSGETTIKKKKKSKNNESIISGVQEISDEIKQKKKKSKNDEYINENSSEETKSKKKKKSKNNESIISDAQEISDETKQKKKKSKNDEYINENNSEETKSKNNESIVSGAQEISDETKQKKKKKSKNVNDETCTETKSKKKKKSITSDVDATREITDKTEEKKKNKSKEDSQNEEILMETKKRKKNQEIINSEIKKKKK